jgi:hypothetical protein
MAAHGGKLPSKKDALRKVPSGTRRRAIAIMWGETSIPSTAYPASTSRRAHKPPPAAKVYNQPAGDAPASQDAQQTGSGSLRKAAKAHVMNVGKISLVRFQLHFAECSIARKESLLCWYWVTNWETMPGSISLLQKLRRQIREVKLAACALPLMQSGSKTGASFCLVRFLVRGAQIERGEWRGV